MAARWWWEEPAHGALCVASSEKQRVSLLPLPPSVPLEQAGELGAQPSFRVRVMPVLPPTPASFGAALAARALHLLRGGGDGGGGGGGDGGGGCGGGGGARCPPPRPVPALSLPYQKKMYQRFVQHEERRRKLEQPTAPPPHAPPPNQPRLSIDDVGLLVRDVSPNPYPTPTSNPNPNQVCDV